jgi:hypothetical protein
VSRLDHIEPVRRITDLLPTVEFLELNSERQSCEEAADGGVVLDDGDVDGGVGSGEADDRADDDVR